MTEKLNTLSLTLEVLQVLGNSLTNKKKLALSILINYLYSDYFYNCESENIHTHTKEGYWKFQGG